MKRLLIIIFGFFSFVSCQQKEASQSKTSGSEHNFPDGIAYEVFVQSFYDTDGDSIGDIKGLTQKLDYLDQLNVDAIWLMPIMPSPTYHKYDVTDYRDIHPDYGTIEDFREFVDEAHQKDIKIIIDLVVNHTSNEHPWFLEAAEDKDSEYRDYYVWGDKDSIADQLAKKETSFDSDNIRQWHPVEGDTLSEHYYGFFWGGMPDLNFDHPAVRREIYDIGRFWLEDIGVDGFRLDAARHIYPDDRLEDNHAFWQEFKREMEKVNPNVYLVGEIWENAEVAAPYAKGLSAFFNFDLAFSILESVKRGEVVSASIEGHGWEVEEDESFIQDLLENREIFKSYNADYSDAIFLSNHDQNRVMSVLQNDPDKAKLAASIMFTLPGTPYIYYGEELGMRGMKPDPRIREPFIWGDKKGQTRWISTEYNNPNDVLSYKNQLQDSNSIFNHYKELTELRSSKQLLITGDLEEIENTEEGLLSYKRSGEGGTLFIFHNLTSKPIFYSPGDKLNANEIVASLNGESIFESDLLSIQPYSTLIMK